MSMIAKSGGEGIEVFHSEFIHRPSLIKEYPGALRDHGLELLAVDVICDLVHRTRSDRNRARDELRKGLDLSLELGASFSHVAGSSLKDGISPADGRKQIAECLLEQVALADAHGLQLAIEDFDPAPDLICRKKDCLELLSLTDYRVKMVFDTGNFLAVGESAVDNLADCYAHIAFCHMKDWAETSFQPDSRLPGRRRGVPLGQGVIPNATVANLLLERNYDGWISLESWPEDGAVPETVVPREMRIVQNWFGAK
jgi:sugar phosphate isomerase/epimerase